MNADDAVGKPGIVAALQQRSLLRTSIRSTMDAIHKIVSRRFVDRSQKRQSKRLVAEENSKDNDDVEWNMYTPNLNPNFDMLSCEVQCNADSSGSSSLNTEEAMTPSPRGNGSGDTCTTKLCRDELNGTDLVKVSSAVRKKFSLANPFSNNQKNMNQNSEADTKKSDDRGSERRNSTQSEAKKAAKDKSKRKKIDIMDVRILGRRQGNENQQLLIDEFDED